MLYRPSNRQNSINKHTINKNKSQLWLLESVVNKVLRYVTESELIGESFAVVIGTD